MYNIYSLNNLDGTPFYIGCTIDMHNRYYAHRNCKINIEKYNAVRSIINTGHKLDMQVLKQTEDRELAELLETEYIELYKFRGFNLLNKLSGGFNPPSYKGHKASKETLYKRFINSPLRKPVKQYDKKGNFIAEFEGVREACRITGVDHRSIAQVAGGSLIRRSAGGFIWKY